MRSEIARMKAFRREVAVVSQISHPNIVQFVGACITPALHAIALEFMAKGTLMDYMEAEKKKTGKKPVMESVVSWALDVSKGMDYCHRNNILQRDLKSRVGFGCLAFVTTARERLNLPPPPSQRLESTCQQQKRSENS